MKEYKSRKFKDLPSIYADAKPLGSIKTTCDYLDKLNKILSECIPPQYVKICHFGAVDTDRNVPILFIEEQQIFHIIRTKSEQILNALSRHNFKFDGILFKVKKYRKTYESSPIYKKLSTQDKDKLQRFADMIGKPELIIDECLADNLEEMEINL